ncbi:MAG: LutB/LldF family L-lactate oxidation iron-sulfur protein [Desulfobacteraceae bacterium]
MARVQTELFNQGAADALKDPVLQRALAGFQQRLGPATAASYTGLPEGPGLRQQAKAVRMEGLRHLDDLLERLADLIRERGGHVFFAEDSAAAASYCRKVARRHNVKRVVKGKSMVSEEIDLDAVLEADGVEVVETDLGQYIVQLAGEPPSHIIAPAIHKTRHEVGRLFAEKLGIAYTDDPPTLTQAARKALREKFLSADMGISGCNLACAETGHITTVSNEGNIRMATTLPRVHVALMGMERIIPRLADHDMLFRLLARGAAAQHMAGYVSYIGGPRQPAQGDGPDEFHLVIIDNGRSRILADTEFREILCCIRCAACLNVCPVYGKIGGYPYGFPYSGPVGAVVTPLLTGISRGKHLFMGDPLCGACKDACPVDIDIPRMLLALRRRLADGDPAWDVSRKYSVDKLAFDLWSYWIRHRGLYEAGLRLGAAGQKRLAGTEGVIESLPRPLDGWTRHRNLSPLTGKSFIRRWREHYGRSGTETEQR